MRTRVHIVGRVCSPCGRLNTHLARVCLYQTHKHPGARGEDGKDIGGYGKQVERERRTLNRVRDDPSLGRHHNDGQQDGRKIQCRVRVVGGDGKRLKQGLWDGLAQCLMWWESR